MLKRILRLVVLFFGITLISFIVMHLAPGSPVDAKNALNPQVSVEAREKLQQLYGLDRPVMTQYADWLMRLAQWDFGNSLVDGEKALTKIGRVVPVTLLLNFLSLFFICAVGIPLGLWAAVRRDSWVDRVISLGSFAGFSVPTFWLALVLMSFFGVQLRALPVSGIHSLFFDEMSFGDKILDVARHLVLPVFVASVTGLAGVTQILRTSTLRVLGENYIRTARAKGLSERRVLFHHGFRNALLPLITILGLSVPGLLGGSVIFESIFSIPGMGRLFFASVFARDYPVVMGILVIGAVLTLLGNLLADLAYAAADPRIRLQ